MILPFRKTNTTQNAISFTSPSIWTKITIFSKNPITLILSNIEILKKNITLDYLHAQKLNYVLFNININITTIIIITTIFTKAINYIKISYVILPFPLIYVLSVFIVFTNPLFFFLLTFSGTLRKIRRLLCVMSTI